MELAQLIRATLTTSVVLTVFSLGLRASTDDVLSLRRRPALLARSLLSMHVIMPLVGLALALAFDLHPAVKIALVALGLSPVPPMLSKRQVSAGGSARYASGLLMAAALFAVAFVPLALEGIGLALTMPLHLSPLDVARIVSMSVIAPIFFALLTRRFAPVFAERISKPLSRVALVLLIAALVPVVIRSSSAMFSLIGNGTLAAFVAFVVVGLAIGHWLGGPEPGVRTVHAFCTASRHPGVALAIASANFPEQKLVLPALLLYLLTGMLLSIPYARWARRGTAISGAAKPSTS